MIPATPLILGAVAPTILAVKYGLQLLKPYVDVLLRKTSAPVHDNTIRLLALALGAVILPAVCAALAPQVHVVFTLDGKDIYPALIFGAASGLAAIGDFHLIALLESGNSPTPPAPAASTPPPTPPAP